MKYHLKEKESSKRTACGRKVEDKDGYGCVAVRGIRIQEIYKDRL